MEATQYDAKPYKGKFQQVWFVRSESNPERKYTVTLTVDDVWQCGCPGWTQRQERFECKHIRHVKSLQPAGRLQGRNMLVKQAAKPATRFSSVEV